MQTPPTPRAPLFSATAKYRMHRAPVPTPIEDPIPGETPPGNDPIPHQDPTTTHDPIPHQVPTAPPVNDPPPPG
ncbi:MAG: hypothetical protein JWQ10_1879 [Herbaspirillum sp.]|jgi:hypothetical protein|nr:hypothetical protein [Herbaspirillum sp.]